MLYYCSCLILLNIFQVSAMQEDDDKGIEYKFKKFKLNNNNT